MGVRTRITVGDSQYPREITLEERGHDVQITVNGRVGLPHNEARIEPWVTLSLTPTEARAIAVNLAARADAVDRQNGVHR